MKSPPATVSNRSEYFSLQKQSIAEESDIILTQPDVPLRSGTDCYSLVTKHQQRHRNRYHSDDIVAIETLHDAILGIVYICVILMSLFQTCYIVKSLIPIIIVRSY